MSTNRYGVDISYFHKWFDRSLKNLSDYRPDELARELARMSRTADSKAVLEPEFSASLHAENEKLKREIDELKVMVNVLRDEFNSPSADYDSIEAVLAKTPAQSLHDHDMAIAEAVRSVCVDNTCASCGCFCTEELSGIDLEAIVKGVK